MAVSSIAPDVVWNWVIEAVAISKQTKISTLLVKAAPLIYGDAGRDTREIVSLRILESLFDHGNEATVDPKTRKICFDFSMRCEDVLRLILNEIFDSSVCCEDIFKKILNEAPELMTKLEKGKWDVAPFLMHKRSSLPKCILEKLKEAMLVDNNPLLAPLKEKYKVLISNESEDTSPANDELPLTPRNVENNFQENVVQDDNMPQHTYTDIHIERVSVDSMENVELVKSKDSNNIVQANNERANDDDDDDDDAEVTDIAAKKEAFLRSRCTTSQDSLTLTQWSELDRCMKCNGRGELLHCSSASCPLRFHESCVGSTGTLEENTEFFCPFCAWSRALSEYQEAKRNASLARKKLQAFTNITKQSEAVENEDIQVGDKNIDCTTNEKDSAQPDPMMSDVNVVNDVNDVDDDLSLEQATQNPMPEPSTSKQKGKIKESQRLTESNSTTNLRKRKKLQAFTNTTKQSEAVENEDIQMGDNNIDCTTNEKDSAQPDPMMSNVNDVNDVDDDLSLEQATQNPMPEPSTSKQKRKIKESQRLTESSPTKSLRKRKAKQSTPDPMISDVNVVNDVNDVDDDLSVEQATQNPMPEPSTSKQKCKIKKSQRLTESSSTKSLRKRKAKQSTPSSTIPGIRRTKLPWTKEEEEALKEGVKRFSSGDNEKMPWKKILVSGHDVFHKWRTTIDLKDKWRNMCKK